jgi:predicted DsbA family dithiol-disulfide isomerase
MTERVTAVAAEVGLRFDMARAIAANTRPAHQLIEVAYAESGFAAQQVVATELFRSHFERGEDVADADVLKAAARRAGLSDQAAERAATDPEVAASVTAGLLEAQQLGVTSVPTFVANRAVGVAGAQPSETLLGLLRQAGQTA